MTAFAALPAWAWVLAGFTAVACLVGLLLALGLVSTAREAAGDDDIDYSGGQ